jgi:DNA-binding MarR family transcriptional regulator
VKTQLSNFERTLERYYLQHAEIPSLSGLAALWGFASKASSARIAQQFVAAGILGRTPDGRLQPGPNFSCSKEQGVAHSPDDVDRAASRWTAGYDRTMGLAYELTARIRQLAQAIEASREDQARPHGLAPGEIEVLDALYRLGPPFRASPTVLRRSFLISLAGLGKRVNRLEELGFAARRADPKDGRGLLVELTRKGRDLLASLVEADRTSPHISWTMALGEGDCVALNALLRTAQHEIEKKRKKRRGGK